MTLREVHALAMADHELLQPVIEGLEKTLRVLSAEDRDYSGLLDLHRILAGKGVVSAAPARALRGEASFAEAVQPALEGMRLALRQLDKGHWARLVIDVHYSQLWWATQRPDAHEPGPRPALMGPPT